MRTITLNSAAIGRRRVPDAARATIPTLSCHRGSGWGEGGGLSDHQEDETTSFPSPDAAVAPAVPELSLLPAEPMPATTTHTQHARISGAGHQIGRGAI